MTSLLCRLGLHARVSAAEPSVIRCDLHRCRRCPAQWRIGSHVYGWGSIRYRHRIADASGPYDHAAAVEAEDAAWKAWQQWSAARDAS
jgi:hypothetical protein